MSPPFNKCPKCGGYLDPGERCTCNGREEPTRHSPPKYRRPTAPPPPKPARIIKTCKECLAVWAVNANAKIPPSGYICPDCRKKQDKE